jgi:hypothetical protein
MGIYDASEAKPHKMNEETFDFIMDCILDATDMHDLDRSTIYKNAREYILEKTEISG